MAVIGIFAKHDKRFVGHIKTLNIDIGQVELVPVDTLTERGPSHRVVANGAEIGAAWSKLSQQNRAYFSLSMDDASFPAPLNASLFESDQEPGSYRLVWDRQEAKAEAQ